MAAPSIVVGLCGAGLAGHFDRPESKVGHCGASGSRDLDAARSRDRSHCVADKAYVFFGDGQVRRILITRLYDAADGVNQPRLQRLAPIG